MDGRFYPDPKDVPELAPVGVHRVWLCRDKGGKPYLLIRYRGKTRTVMDREGDEYRGPIGDLTMVRVIADIPANAFDAESINKLYDAAF